MTSLYAHVPHSCHSCCAKVSSLRWQRRFNCVCHFFSISSLVPGADSPHVPVQMLHMQTVNNAPYSSCRCRWAAKYTFTLTYWLYVAGTSNGKEPSEENAQTMCSELACPSGYTKYSDADSIPCAILACTFQDVPTCCNQSTTTQSNKATRSEICLPLPTFCACLFLLVLS
jgi:hypothetical protein